MNDNYNVNEEENLSFDNYFKKLLNTRPQNQLNNKSKNDKINSILGKTENIANLIIKDDTQNKNNNNIRYNQNNFDMNRFSVDIQQSSNKKNEINVSDFISDSLRIQRENQEKYRKKIFENLAIISESQEKNEKELKEDIKNLNIDDEHLLTSSQSSTLKRECDKEIKNFLNK